MLTTILEVNLAYLLSVSTTSVKGTQNTNPALVLSLSAAELLIEEALLPFCRLCDATTRKSDNVKIYYIPWVMIDRPTKCSF